MKNKQWDKVYQNEHGVLKNKLGIETDDKLRDQEEARISFEILTTRINEFRSIDPFESNSINKIHKLLFSEIYEWAGEARKINIYKGSHSFLHIDRFDHAIKYIFASTPLTFEDVIEKYNDINQMHIFREGNGRTGRIWLNLTLEKTIGKHINFGMIGKDEYMNAMKPNDHAKLAILFERGLFSLDEKTYKERWIHNAEISYEYEGYYIPKAADHRLLEEDNSALTYKEFLQESPKDYKPSEK